jgi:hypothetical protein
VKGIITQGKEYKLSAFKKATFSLAETQLSQMEVFHVFLQPL